MPFTTLEPILNNIDNEYFLCEYKKCESSPAALTTIMCDGCTLNLYIYLCQPHLRIFQRHPGYLVDYFEELGLHSRKDHK